MNRLLAACAFVLAPAVAIADDCSDIRSVSELLKNDPKSLAVRPDRDMNSLIEEQVYYYHVVSKSLSGAKRCSVVTDSSKPSVVDAVDISYECSWNLESGDAAVETAKSMVATIEKCLGLEAIKVDRKSDSGEVAVYRFKDEVSTWRGPASFRARLSGTRPKNSEAGRLRFRMSLIYEEAYE